MKVELTKAEALAVYTVLYDARHILLRHRESVIVKRIDKTMSLFEN